MNASPWFEQFLNSKYFEYFPNASFTLFGCETGTVLSLSHPIINEGNFEVCFDSKIYLISPKSKS